MPLLLLVPAAYFGGYLHSTFSETKRWVPLICAAGVGVYVWRKSQ